jgi:hypothetical protein
LSLVDLDSSAAYPIDPTGTRHHIGPVHNDLAVGCQHDARLSTAKNDLLLSREHDPLAIDHEIDGRGYGFARSIAWNKHNPHHNRDTSGTGKTDQNLAPNEGRPQNNRGASLARLAPLPLAQNPGIAVGANRDEPSQDGVAWRLRQPNMWRRRFYVTDIRR